VTPRFVLVIESRKICPAFGVLVGLLLAPLFQPSFTHDILRRSSVYNLHTMHQRAKAQIRGSRQKKGVRRKERGREKPRIKKRKAGRSREHSRSTFDTFWYNYLDEDEMMEL